MATETDAARDRVIEARAAFDDELEDAGGVGAGGGRHPGQDQAQPGQDRRGRGRAPRSSRSRVRSACSGPAKRAVRGPAAPMPKSMLPEEIEKALRKLGADGDKVRGALERDFADYAQKCQAGALEPASEPAPGRRAADPAPRRVKRPPTELVSARPTRCSRRASRSSASEASVGGRSTARSPIRSARTTD